MHVLCEYDGWLYVCVPRNEPGWLMDVDGQYGFVKAADVRTAASFVQSGLADGIIRSIGTNAPARSPGAFLIPGADFAIMG